MGRRPGKSFGYNMIMEGCSEAVKSNAQLNEFN